MPTTVPEVAFSDQRLSNGLRIIVAEDHLAPVVAVNLWYDVGSKHEVPGKTGFAHLFEHVMFQGTKHVPEDKHFEYLQKAGASNVNGSTANDPGSVTRVKVADPSRMVLITTRMAISRAMLCRSGTSFMAT